ncbi:response regulator transcription factor [Paraburkholderia sp.]|uniref:response regulator n=1 Tax=Paraburkholderia sp. TaxID=1926495 RepID=UPI00238E05AA|nr:response regulator transcription factor [Paraburkholderia sp.]MDE1182379.1 response regulator transcription factor [Paraburkholderia sp.]
MKKSVLLIDDHAVVRQGLSSLLAATSDFQLIGEASHGTVAIQMARELQPDIMIVDLLMPDVSGVTVIRSIRAVSPDTTLAVLTSSEDDDLALSAIEAGAFAFLLKSMSGDELLDALRVVSRGEVYIHPSIARTMMQAVRQRQNPVPTPFAILTVRELAVLRALGEGASNARLADTLNISEKTVKAHIGSILAKLNLADRTEAVAFAWRNGLMIADD